MNLKSKFSKFQRIMHDERVRLDLSEIPIDTTISVENLSTYKEEGQLRFQGTYSPITGKEIERILVYGNGVLLGADQPSDIHLENGPSTKQFHINLPWDGTCHKYEFHAEYANAARATFDSELIRVNLHDYEEREQYKEAVSSRLDALPMPPGDIVFQTQGTENVAAYKVSIPVSMFRFKKMLHELGFESETFNRVLDFGCGTGRLLCGWQVDNPHRELYGVDYNGQLIDWASSNLPSNMHFSRNALYPPLNFASDFFDCIYLISVFTHLTLRNQFLWLEEFRRILKKGQPMIISLHGPDLLNPYRIQRPHVYRDIMTKRYWDNSLEAHEEGKNPFISFHMPDFAVHTLFSGWKVLGYYKGGRVRNQLLAAGKQDVYVLTH